MKAHIIILNYNGEKLLGKYLPSILEAAKRAKTPTRVTVLDNVSQDQSRRVVDQFQGHVEWASAKANRVLCSYNDFLAQIPEEIAILLNNDMNVDPGFVDPLVEPFKKDSEVFLVTSKCLSETSNQFEGGRTRFQLRYGIFWASSYFPGYERVIDVPGPTMAAGFGAFDRKKFLELGGYDDLYLPGRLEDSDICFRAWRSGWKCLYEPKAVIYHAGGKTFNREFGKSGTFRINDRNSFLFLWKNLEDPWMLFQHISLLPLRLLEGILRGKRSFVSGFIDAIRLMSRALERRRAEKSAPRVRSDREIFNLV